MLYCAPWLCAHHTRSSFIVLSLVLSLLCVLLCLSTSTFCVFVCTFFHHYICLSVTMQSIAWKALSLYWQTVLLRTLNPTNSTQLRIVLLCVKLKLYGNKRFVYNTNWEHNTFIQIIKSNELFIAQLMQSILLNAVCNVLIVQLNKFCWYYYRT